MLDSAELISLSDYSAQIADTDILNKLDINPILLGLYGEVGGIMSTAKKHIREKLAYRGFERAAEEEFGDTLWYLAALCRRLNISLIEILAEAKNNANTSTVSATHTLVNHITLPASEVLADAKLFKLGCSAAELLKGKPERAMIVQFAGDYLNALQAANLAINEIALSNLRKARGAFIAPQPGDLIDFDASFRVEEQLPQRFRILINQRLSGKSYLQWNGVFIGDPLTDNMSDPDGYRFHDVFHFAHSAILHWSPVVRALIKHKRKSKDNYDETQDSGRAIVVEEGLTAWIFIKAKELNFFEGQDRVSLGILKAISEFVAGYEVSQCPLKLWERAILDGYKVFRQIHAAKGGWIIGDRVNRTIKYKKLELAE